MEENERALQQAREDRIVELERELTASKRRLQQAANAESAVAQMLEVGMIDQRDDGSYCPASQEGQQFSVDISCYKLEEIFFTLKKLADQNSKMQPAGNTYIYVVFCGRQCAAQESESGKPPLKKKTDRC